MSAERMLWGPFDLTFTASGEVVRDVEALARGVMGAERWPIYLEAADNDELLGFLLGESVVLERRYAPRDGIEARPWLFQRLRWASRDWRDRERRRPPVLGDFQNRVALRDDPDFDAARADVAMDDRAGLGGGSVGEPSDPPPGYRGDAGLDALRRLLEGGDRPLLREIEALGLGPPPGARGRTSRARRQLARLDRRRRELVERREQARLEREALAA